MERKIGETFEFEGKTLQVKATNDDGCKGCIFNVKCTRGIKSVTGFCRSGYRDDKKDVIFVEVKDEQPQEQAEQPRELNLCEILKDCPKGTKFYSSIFGEETYLFGIDNYEGNPCPIAIYGKLGEVKKFYLSSKGHPFANGCGECVLFPSATQRDWSKFTAPWLKKERFDPKTLKAFDKVIARNEYDEWSCTLFSHINNRPDTRFIYETCESVYEYCIPYNDDTKHLVGTKKEVPEYYRYWED